MLARGPSGEFRSLPGCYAVRYPGRLGAREASHHRRPLLQRFGRLRGLSGVRPESVAHNRLLFFLSFNAVLTAVLVRAVGPAVSRDYSERI